MIRSFFNMIMSVMIIFGGITPIYAQNPDKQVHQWISESVGFSVDGDKTGDLLDLPLNPKQVILLTIQHQPRLKELMASLGEKKAEALERSLLVNPQFSFRLRRSNEENTKKNIEIEFSQDVGSLLTWPYRQSISKQLWTADQYAVAYDVLEYLKDTLWLYYDWVAARQIEDVGRDILKAQEAALELANNQFKEGNINKLKLSEAQMMFSQGRIEWLSLQGERVQLEFALKVRLGLDDKEMLSQVQELIPDQEVNWDENEMILKAKNQRWDFRGLDYLIERDRREGVLSHLGLLSDTVVGYNQEREPSGHRLKGFFVDGKVPLFNQGQSDRGKWMSLRAEHVWQKEALINEAKQEIRQEIAFLKTQNEIVKEYQNALRFQSEVTKESLLHYNYMLTDVFHLLQSRQEEMHLQKEYIMALKVYWQHKLSLYFSVGELGL